MQTKSNLPKLAMPLGVIFGALVAAFILATALPLVAHATDKTDDKSTSSPVAQDKNEKKTPKKQDDKKADSVKKDTKKDDKRAKSDDNSKDAAKKSKKTSSETYDYVAQPGDSYTLMARKAIQTYGIVNHINLSGAQIIFAETNLTEQAGSPRLNAGEKVKLKVSDVQNWVYKAQKLNKKQIAAWRYYVQFVNFDTNAVGETAKQ